ncbi:ATP-dependent RNA helicase DbpA [Echinimonas agarilytica]|uniref:ATP-dependent RNA helicase DbpA n=1 Tax=Echinimonas agarilytica TaxID=1215918 RepID=A0AA42B6H3_9GAMM|nr:ATP-dependent RNA helicase DbpA [Echinimonas agarilytica]MCM2678533.1 ATP-dependent RNA helicase DbpA [Echinimonas agarilytica]
MSTTDFSSLPLKPGLLENLSSLGYEQMTPIQAQSLPDVLAGKDVIAQGKTGSGKTAAFALGLLQRLNVKRFRVQTLVLCPTRELADQVAKEIRKIARQIHNIKVLTLCGGLPMGPQIGSLEHGAHIIVGTPGRVEDHLLKGRLILDELNTFVLDEADRMLEMGFQSAIDAIIDYAPKDRQTLLFSATFPTQIKSIADRIMVNPTMVKVESTHDTNTIEQNFYKVTDNTSRYEALRVLLLKYQPESSVVFCNTKRETQEVADILADDGFNVVALHGDLEQRVRDQTLVRFANKSASVLVATDVAARGLDIESLDAVINYHVSHDPEVHVHRIGRTGRAGSKGLALTLFNDNDGYKVAMLEEYIGISTDPSPLPNEDDIAARPAPASMATLCIDGGKKHKVRPGDIVGALTGKSGIPGDAIGKIHVFDRIAYVAVRRDVANSAFTKLSEGKLKGRTFRVWRVRG